MPVEAKKQHRLDAVAGFESELEARKKGST
jgi:hypothetical protein